MIDNYVTLAYIAVGILWGCSNPFIKHAQSTIDKSSGELSQAQETSQHSHIIMTVYEEIYSLITKPKLLLPFIINQSGSLVYYYLLSSEPITMASPICNSLTFIFTALTGQCLFHEEIKHPLCIFAGVILILIGIYICLL